FNWYLFDELTDIPSSGRGLLVRLRSDRNRVAYYSGYRPMKVMGQYDMAAGASVYIGPTARPAGLSGSYGASTTTFWLPNENPNERPWQSAYFVACFTTTETTVTCSYEQWSLSNGTWPWQEPPLNRNQEGSILAISVAGL